MPTTVEFPFVEAVLHFPGGNSFHRPLAWMEVFALYPLGDDIRAALSGISRPYMDSGQIKFVLKSMSLAFRVSIF